MRQNLYLRFQWNSLITWILWQQGANYNQKDNRIKKLNCLFCVFSHLVSRANRLIVFSHSSHISSNYFSLNSEVSTEREAKVIKKGWVLESNLSNTAKIL